MSVKLVPGQNCVLSATRIEAVGSAGSAADFCAILLDANGKITEDADFVFYGQPKNSCVELTERPDSGVFAINLDLVPEYIQKIEISVSADRGTVGELAPLSLKITGPGQEELVCEVNSEKREEKVLILGQVYRRGGQWKFRFLDQGFKNGLRALAEHYGLEVADDDATAPAQTAAQSTASTTALRIFFSYGHDDNATLVESIKTDLERRNPGWNIWFDKNNIHAGDDWRSSIYDGINKSDVVVAWLSRHSVREPGVCLDELRIAAGDPKHYLASVLLESPEIVAPPLSISHVQYLDLSQWKIKRDNDLTRFKEWLQERVNTLENILANHSSFSGEIEELKDTLKISKYGSSRQDRIKSLLRESFTGREWLFAEIESWLKNPGGRKVFCVTGEPGIGKSALVAQFASQNKIQVAGIHFCEAGSALDDPKTVLISLAFQLGTRLPSYRKYLLDNKPDPEKMSAADAFHKFFVEPGVNGIDGGQTPFLLIIDGLDEAAEELAAYIAQKHKEFPSWLYLLVTSRPNEIHVKPHLAALRPRVLSASDDRNERDARKYAELILADADLSPAERKIVADNLSASANGNFRYLSFIRDMIRDGALEPREFLRAEVFPSGLASLYRRFMERAFPDRDNFEKAAKPILNILAGLGSSPIDYKLLVSILKSEYKLTESEIKVAFARLGSLIKFAGADEEKRVSVYHKSVGDWLLGDTNLDYALDVEDAQTRVVKRLWNRFMRDADLDEEDDGERLQNFETNIAPAFLKILFNRLVPGAGMTPDRLENLDQDFLKQTGITKKSFDKYGDRFPDPLDDDEATRYADVIIYLLNRIFYGKLSSEAIRKAGRLKYAFPANSFPDWNLDFYQTCLSDIEEEFGAESREYLDGLENVLEVYGAHPDPKIKARKKELMDGYANEAKEIYKKDKTYLAEFYGKLANIYAEDAYYDDATKLFAKALKRARKDFKDFMDSLPKYKRAVAVKMFDAENDKELTEKQETVAAELAREYPVTNLAEIYVNYVKATRFRDPDKALQLFRDGHAFILRTDKSSFDFDYSLNDTSLDDIEDDLLMRTGNCENIIEFYEDQLEAEADELEDEEKAEIRAKLAEAYEQADAEENAAKIVELRKAVADYYQERPEEKSAYASALQNLASALINYGGDAEGRAVARQALDLELTDPEEFAENYPRALELAEALSEDTPEAKKGGEDKITEFLKDRERVLGVDNPVIYEIYRQFLLYNKLSGFDLAGVAERALELAERHYGKNSEAYGSSLLTLAYQLWTQKRDSQKALALAREGVKTLKLFRSWRDSLQIDNDILVMALLYELGEYEACVTAYRAIEREIYADYEGDDENAPSIYMAYVAWKVAGLSFKKLKRLDEARENLEKAAEVGENGEFAGWEELAKLCQSL